MPVTTISLGTMEIGRRMDMGQSKEFIEIFLDSGYTELDTAFMYAGGTSGGENGGLTEEYMGKIGAVKPENTATKVNPGDGKTLSAKSVRHQFECSLKKLNAETVDILYLHWPCMEVPLKETLAEVDKLFKEDKFKRFGLSNFVSWQVAAVQEICRANGFVTPTLYQGMYNCLTRMVENELFPCLRKYNMGFYCYNPLAGGLLTGKHSRVDAPQEKDEEGRFNGLSWGQKYRERFWRESYFDALDVIRGACEKEGVCMIGAALRWVTHHSKLDDKLGDGLVIGASTPEHLKYNLEVLKGGPLPDGVVEAIERAHLITKGHGPQYFRNVESAFKA